MGGGVKFLDSDLASALPRDGAGGDTRVVSFHIRKINGSKWSRQLPTNGQYDEHTLLGYWDIS